jgi:hypothetical protein
MSTVIVWLLIFNAYQGHSDAISTMSPFTYPEWKDCDAHCVKTRILVQPAAK